MSFIASRCAQPVPPPGFATHQLAVD